MKTPVLRWLGILSVVGMCNASLMLFVAFVAEIEVLLPFGVAAFVVNGLGFIVFERAVLHAVVPPRATPKSDRPEWAWGWCPTHGWRNQDGASFKGEHPRCNQIVRREGGIPILCGEYVEDIKR